VKRLTLVLAVILACVPGQVAGGSTRRPAVFRASIHPIGAALAKRMTGISWHAGCPVSLADVRLVKATYWGFDARAHAGVLVVNRDSASAIVSVLRRLYAKRFPIRRMRLVDDYGGSDFRSIEADNTSAFNCRAATGSTRWSEHAYGHAIDVNPIENPYVSDGSTSHTASVAYLDRSRHRPGMAYPGGDLVRAFEAIGWGWGGYWSGSIQDYQHFSLSGR
jgi:hypothetical protein